MRAIVVGPGAVGACAARQLFGEAGLRELLIVGRYGAEDLPDTADGVVASLGPPARRGRWQPPIWVPPNRAERRRQPGFDVAVLACPPPHARLAKEALAYGVHVVSVSRSMTDVRDLLDLDAQARAGGLSVAVGAGFSPGLACVLACQAARGFDVVEEVRVAWAGEGGAGRPRPSLPRRSAPARQDIAFPEPLGVHGCSPLAGPLPMLLGPVLPGTPRVTALVAASRPGWAAFWPGNLHPAARHGQGALRVEVTGTRPRQANTGSAVREVVASPPLAAGVVAAVTARWLVEGRGRPGAGGLASLLTDAGPFLDELDRRGVKAGEGCPAR